VQETWQSRGKRFKEEEEEEIELARKPSGGYDEISGENSWT
jgi:hypothetical protein